MKKVLIVGAGAQGASCASVLSRDKDTSEIGFTKLVHPRPTIP